MNYLIYGNSYRLIDAELQKILNNRKYENIDFESVSFDEVLEDISYESMFNDEKILVIRNFDSILSSKKENEKKIDKLVEYLLNAPNENITLIFISGEKLSTKGVGKSILSFLKVIETPIITKPYELDKLLGPYIRKEGYNITDKALSNFSVKCISNYDLAINEFEKLKTMKPDNNSITERDVEEFVSNYNMNDIFGFKDAVLNRNISLALEMLEDLENSKMEIVPLVVMIAKEYQTLYNVKILSNKKMTNDQISQELNKMHPYRVKVLREMSSKYTEEEIEKLILELCNIDLRLVSEDNLGFDELRKFLLLL